MRARPQSIHLSLPSDIAVVDYAVELLRTLLRYHGVRDTSPLLVVSRELLKNAVVHGNRNRHEIPVTLTLSGPREGKYWVEVEDRGQGFDVHDPTLGGGEGFRVVRAHTVDLAFNERGNRVSASLDASGVE